MGAALAEKFSTTTITVERIADQKEGRKTIGVLSTDDVWYNIWAADVDAVRVGETYEFEYKGDGRYIQTKTIRHITPHGHQPTAVPQSPPPKETKKMDQQFYKPWSPEDRRSAFICAQMTAFIRAGQVRLKENEISGACAEIAAGYDYWLEQDKKLAADR
jgi:hypothetical protein